MTELIAFRQCQMQYYFFKHKFPVETELKLVTGKQVHSHLYNTHAHQSTCVDTFSQALDKTAQDNIVRTVREFRVSKETDRYILIGRIDEIRITPTQIFVIDDKNIDTLTGYDKIKYTDQLQIYSALLFDEYLPWFDVIFQLRQAVTKQIFFSDLFIPQTVYDWEHTIGLILDYWEGELVLQKTIDKKICNQCLFQRNCWEY